MSFIMITLAVYKLFIMQGKKNKAVHMSSDLIVNPIVFTGTCSDHYYTYAYRYMCAVHYQ